MKKSLLMMFLLLMSVASYAEDFDIVGTWYQYESDQTGLDGIWVFNVDGTGTHESFDDGVSDGISSFSYQFDLSTCYLALYMEGEEDDPSVMTITIVSPTEFTYSEYGDVLTWIKQGSTGMERKTIGPQAPMATYSLDGCWQPNIQHGLNIIRRADGSVVKVFVK